VGKEAVAASHELSGERRLARPGGADECYDRAVQAHRARVQGLESADQADAVEHRVEKEALPFAGVRLGGSAEQRPTVAIEVEARLAPEGEQRVRPRAST